ncbi:MAG: CsbD family protein [Ornithinibacter sp.]
MGIGDKMDNMKDDLTGQAKEAEGKATGDESRETQGKAEQSKADLKKAGENVKDSFNN